MMHLLSEKTCIASTDVRFDKISMLSRNTPPAGTKNAWREAAKKFISVGCFPMHPATLRNVSTYRKPRHGLRQISVGNKSRCEYRLAAGHRNPGA
jgi:hypothetical protein